MKYLEQIKNKIVLADDLRAIMDKEQAAGRKFAFSNGCFDLVHQGHIDYLSKSRDLADYLIIGLNSDASVRRLKGPRRPINDEYSRALMLASFVFVDYVVLFADDTPYNLIKTLQPDILIKGSDYKVEDIVGYDIVTARGGKVATLDFVPGFSTSLIEQRILQEKE
ncbi:MAG: D-glycero-beta-D-manno-heptose 1-phosphate adenylyltransferase [Bacteroidales bacterium]|nr:D-glycero-beta-D-manno-heptose 1-phosphate adenylyltransferase [Bacteroidales bacterium]MBR5831959.1 D-glycero-beta-D-manno-heptose 1-phosphate adenylyltransferase [Bacteroidales bacterium]